MTAWMLKGNALAPYYGLYARRADAVARCGALALTARYTVVRVTVTEVPTRRASLRHRPKPMAPVPARS